MRLRRFPCHPISLILSLAPSLSLFLSLSLSTFLSLVLTPPRTGSPGAGNDRADRGPSRTIRRARAQPDRLYHRVGHVLLRVQLPPRDCSGEPTPSRRSQPPPTPPKSSFFTASERTGNIRNSFKDFDLKAKALTGLFQCHIRSKAVVLASRERSDLIWKQTLLIYEPCLMKCTT